MQIVSRQVPDFQRLTIFKIGGVKMVGGKVVMIVDNEVEMGVALAGLFELDGYNVVICANGKEARVKFRQDITHVVSDVEMPGMNGRDLVSILLRRKPELKVVLLTGNWGIFSQLPKDKNIQGLLKPASFREIKKALGLPNSL